MDNIKHEPPVIFMDTRDNFHRRGDKTDKHDPKTCALCNFND